MAYEKLNLENGTVFTAEHVAHIEDGITTITDYFNPESLDATTYASVADGISIDSSTVIYKVGRTISTYISLSGTISNNATLFTVASGYRPNARYVMCSIRSKTSPFAEVGTLWINKVDGKSVAYVSSSVSGCYLCYEHSI